MGKRTFSGNLIKKRFFFFFSVSPVGKYPPRHPLVDFSLKSSSSEAPKGSKNRRRDRFEAKGDQVNWGCQFL